MKKECIFCGQRIDSKSKEHVLPKWLIALTGDPKRLVTFGLDKTLFMAKVTKFREFAFDQFQFPACIDCNALFSRLEAFAEPVIRSLLDEKPLSDLDFHILLDWLDKVRIGIWLGLRYLDNNFADIDPKFHIITRLGKKDRMLGIYRTSDEREGLTTIGCDGLAFIYNPSCFAMIVNELYIFNMSTDFLFSRRLGFPFPVKGHQRKEDRSTLFLFSKGRERVMLPLLRYPLDLKGTEIYQPMFPHWKNCKEFYDIEYVHSNSLNFAKGAGSIFLQQDRNLYLYPHEPSDLWIPKARYPKHQLGIEVISQTLKWQERLLNTAPSLDELPSESKKHWKKISALGIKMNRTMRKSIKEKEKKIQ